MSVLVAPRYVSIALLMVARHVESVVLSAESPISAAYALNPVVGCPSVDATYTISIRTATVDMFSNITDLV